MRRRDIRKSNQNLMFSVMAMAIAVILVVVLFWYLCMPVK